MTKKDLRKQFISSDEFVMVSSWYNSSNDFGTIILTPTNKQKKETVEQIAIEYPYPLEHVGKSLDQFLDIHENECISWDTKKKLFEDMVNTSVIIGIGGIYIYKVDQRFLDVDLVIRAPKFKIAEQAISRVRRGMLEGRGAVTLDFENSDLDYIKPFDAASDVSKSIRYAMKEMCKPKEPHTSSDLTDRQKREFRMLEVWFGIDNIYKEMQKQDSKDIYKVIASMTGRTREDVKRSCYHIFYML